ncbi:MAG TPA: flippase-like domain-containing protein [Desulfobacterales bacterium]|nr:flippase-like domain-containing protein [Desulfobacterales bacterium]HIP38431.1 flippase-like domain-containing protein [Desulfocapsa sulfexigens]
MKRISYILRLLITAVLLYYVLQKVGLFDTEKRADLFVLLQSVSIPILFLSFFVSLLLNLSSAYKWYLLLRSRGVTVSFFKTWALYMIGIFFSLFLPTSMGGDLIRIHELGKMTGKRAEAAASVFVERFSGMVILFLLTIVALFMQRELLSVAWMTISLLFAVTASLALIWVIVDERPYRFITKLLSNRVGFIDKILAKVDKIHCAVLEYRDDRAALIIAILNTFVFYFLAVLNVYVTALAFNAEVQFSELLVAVPLIMFIMNLPISIGGIGLMEFAFIFVFEISGYSSALALSTALLMRLKSFFDAGMGGILYPLLSGDTALVSEKYTNEENELK